MYCIAVPQRSMKNESHGYGLHSQPYTNVWSPSPAAFWHKVQVDSSHLYLAMLLSKLDYMRGFKPQSSRFMVCLIGLRIAWHMQGLFWRSLGVRPCSRLSWLQRTQLRNHTAVQQLLMSQAQQHPQQSIQVTAGQQALCPRQGSSSVEVPNSAESVLLLLKCSHSRTICQRLS